METFERILNTNEVPRIGDTAIRFIAQSTQGSLKSSDFIGKWIVLFSFSGDFTPVCTSELIAFSKMYPEFQKRNCELLGLSFDSVPSHLAWMNQVYTSTGIPVPFPLLSDTDMTIAKQYNMIAPNTSRTQPIRAVYVIDPSQKIRAIMQYPITTGRNTGEMLRLLDALQMADTGDAVTPANWILGQMEMPQEKRTATYTVDPSIPSPFIL